MTTADWALVVSLFSLIVSGLAFVWNIWSKWIHPKPSVRVGFGVIDVVEVDEVHGPYLQLSAVNHGPTETTLKQAMLLIRRGLFRRSQLGLLNVFNDIPRYVSDEPAMFRGMTSRKLAVGEQCTVYLVFDHEALRTEPAKRIGFGFRRKYWAPRSDLKRAVKRIREVIPHLTGDELQPRLAPM